MALEREQGSELGLLLHLLQSQTKFLAPFAARYRPKAKNFLNVVAVKKRDIVIKAAKLHIGQCISRAASLNH